jgi:hypothetical protein
MAAPKPEIRGFGKSKSNIREIKDKLLRPALTSHFLCQFTPPDAVVKFIRTRIEDSGIPSIDYPVPNDQDLITLSCSEASLPGSSLATIDIDNDFPGVSEKHAYRRLYDDRADFTFYIDSDYKIITFFENWIAYCSGETNLTEQRTRQFSYRANYPDNYKTDNLYITKFERDLNSGGRFLQYKFMNAYPISISSLPVSYDTSQLLKCNVSFFYSRYVISSPKSQAKNVTTPDSRSPGNRELDVRAATDRALNSLSGNGFGDAILEQGALSALQTSNAAQAFPIRGGSPDVFPEER